jgi:NADH dehydrogenase
MVSQRPARPRVVVVGAGFGGMELVRRLSSVEVDTLLLDQNNYHLFTPLLYQVASALLDPSEIARPVRAMLSGLPNADFRMARVTRIDFEGRKLHTSEETLGYDYLVLASGSTNDFFGNRSVEQGAFDLKTLPSALALRNHILSQFEEAAWTRDPDRRRQLLTIAVVGGGPTGVEYAGALTELIHLLVKKDFRHVDLGPTRVLLLEATGRLLSVFDPRLQQAALRTLQRKGVEVMLNTPVKEWKDGMLVVGDGQSVAAGTVVWLAGVRGAVPGDDLSGLAGRQNRLRVQPTLQLAEHREVFVMGDLAEVSQNGQLLPMVIPVAQQQARLVADNIRRALSNQPLLPFHFRDPGMMATIGRNAAVAHLGRLRLSGFIGWVVWLGFHLLQVISFRNRLLVLINWMSEYFLLERHVRLILAAERESPSPSPLRGGPGRG